MSEPSAEDDYSSIAASTAASSIATTTIMSPPSMMAQQSPEHPSLTSSIPATPLPNGDTSSTSSSASVSRSASIQSLIAGYVKPFSKDRDAGNRPLDHYKSKMAPWRNNWRNAILPLIRWETPILARIQQRCRSPFLDIYFVLTANFGAHTFYVIMLPLSFWYGRSHLGRSLIFCLGFGVYLTNAVKDLFCLPRPLSPPLHRLTMSGSAALEYGFPSTHTANAISVSLVAAEWIYNSKDSFESVNNYYWLHAFNVIYFLSVVVGRVYCGMHGFLDVIGGLIIGIVLWWIRFVYSDAMDNVIMSSSYNVLWVVPIVLLLIRMHPEPVDDCPCFDDSVAFLGVVAGTVVGEWRFSSTRFSNIPANHNSIPFSFADVGVTGVFFRFLVGSVLISVWRPVMKRTLHEMLPPVFRIVEKVGLSMPRRFFTPASQYGDIPPSLPDTTFFEPQNITSLFTKVGRARADSVGPQSPADVYESIAYREYQKEKKEQAAAALTQRKNSISSVGSAEDTTTSAFSSSFNVHGSRNDGIEKRPFSNNDTDETKGIHADERFYSESSSSSNSSSCGSEKTNHAHCRHTQETADEELMATIVVPRVRYDVEVVTKFIVYAGVGAIATDIAGVCFVALGI